MPCSSGELWGHHLMPTRIDIDVLLPNGVVVPLKCSRDQTLRDIKAQVWREGQRYPYFHLLSVDSVYVFASVTQDAKKEEFHDENRRLCDLHLFLPFLKLVEPNASTRQESILNSEISAALNVPVNLLDDLDSQEVIEFRRDGVNLCKEIVASREEPYARVMYAYCAQITKSPNKGELFENGLVILKVWVNETHTTVKVYVEANADTVIRQALDVANRRRPSQDSDIECSSYVLKICATQDYLLGSFPVTDYKYIRETVARGDVPQLQIVERDQLYTKLPVEPFHVPAYYRRTYRISENEVSSNDLHLWRIQTSFRVQVLFATFVNATEQVCVKAGIFHGDELLCAARETTNKPYDNPRWNEYLTFDLPVSDIPRSARLCISLCTVLRRRKKEDEFCMLAWGNVNIFDFRGRLVTGKVNLNLWPAPMSESITMFNPLGITGSSFDKESPSLELEFDRYSGPIYFPSKLEILEFAVLSNRYEETNRSERVTDQATAEVEKVYLRQLVSKDALCEVSEQDKALVWKYRRHCLSTLPESLPRLANVVKWSSREQTAQFYALLEEWPPVDMETAVQLLDCKTSDIYVRGFAVKNLDATLSDCNVSDLLLQLVQALKYEPYVHSPLATVLLRRALTNRFIGHYFFWHLRSEITGKTWGDLRLALVLEVYCRGLCGHLQTLKKQVEALEKLTALTDSLKEKRDSAERDRLKFLVEQIKQRDFLEVLENLNSPVCPSMELGTLKIERCRIMDSAKRPLWLVWKTEDAVAGKIGWEETSAIFKNGDDLRQDMLTLQVINLMDELWKQDHLDLKLLSYNCLATGKHVGLIQVVPNAYTVYAIQKGSSIRGKVQLDKKTLHKFLQDHNRDEAKYLKAIDTFTKSCAGYCVATFILGIGDRNPDNIMISEDGHIFHIDFGHFLGHFKKKFGIQRERVPFVLTEDFLCVVAKGADNPTKSVQFQEFQKLCGRAYLSIRKHAKLLISLFTLMLPTGIPELQSIQDVDYLRKTLAVDMNEKEALYYFQNRFGEAYDGGWVTKLDWFFHSLNHG